MNKANSIEAIVTLNGLTESKGGFKVFVDHVRRLEIPKRFHPDDIKRAQRDCEILGEKLKDNPKEAAQLFQYIIDNRHDDARQLAKKLGIDEQEFLADGGGLMWLVVIVVVLWATDVW